MTKKNGEILDSAQSLIWHIQDVFIATVYNNKDKITDQIHTVCIAKEADGSYSVYNAGKTDNNGNYVAKEDYKSLSDAIDVISDKNPQLICLIAIDDKER